MTDDSQGAAADWQALVDWQGRAERTQRLLADPPEVEVGMSPSDVVWEDGKLRLLHYRPIATEVHETPILIVYALVNRPYILDLQPGRSVVEKLLEAGFSVYLIDWGSPTRVDRYLTLDDYVNGYILDCVDVVRREQGVPQVSILGYCMGGTLSVMFTALHPERVRNLILMAAPLDFGADDGILSRWAERQYFDVDKLVDTIGNVPGEFLNNAYSQLNPIGNNIIKFAGLIDKIDDPGFVEMFLRMERWANDGIPHAGEAFREFIIQGYQDNLLVKGKYMVGGQRIDLDQLRMPLLNIVGTKDHLVPPSSGRGFTELIPAEDTQLITNPSGHIGLSVSSRSHRELWPQVIAWLGERSHGEPLDRSSQKTSKKTAQASKRASKKAPKKTRPARRERSPAADGESLLRIPGIGPKTVRNIATIGILSSDELAKADPIEVARAAKVSNDKAKAWIAAART